MTPEEYDAYVAELVAAAPPLSDAQITTLTGLFDYEPPAKAG